MCVGVLDFKGSSFRVLAIGRDTGSLCLGNQEGTFRV